MQKTVESRKKVTRRIGFGSLYRTFKAKIVLHFFLTAIVVVFSTYLNWTNNAIFGESSSSRASCGSGCSHGDHLNVPLRDDTGKSSHIDNSSNSSNTEHCEEYGKYLPFESYWKKLPFLNTIGIKQLITITLLLLSIYLLSNYFSSLLEKGIMVESYFRLKRMLLKKFWRLGIEQKKKNVDGLRVLLENEIEIFSELWEHLPAHLFDSSLTIIIVSIERIAKVRDIGAAPLAFSFALSLLFLVVYDQMSDYSTKKYENYKKVADEESVIVNKQLSNGQLIENMGLTSFYENLWDKHARKTQFSEKKFGRSVSLLTIVVSFLPRYYRYFSLSLVSKSVSLRTALSNVIPFFLIFDSLRDILDCFKERVRYKLACTRIDSFLSIEEREENLEKENIVDFEVEEVLLTNVDFKYNTNNQLVLANYSGKFSKGLINRITSGNGTGKTTILYLILGIIKPLSGKVLVKFSNGKTMDLHKEINLREWREKVVVYLSHDNLIENGSTGQKQLENIFRTLDQRKSSRIFIFDESANALDSKKQELVTEELKKMVNEDRVVILVQHKTNLSDNYSKGK